MEEIAPAPHVLDGKADTSQHQVKHPFRFVALILCAMALCFAMLAACELLKRPPSDPESALIEEGRAIFFNETFEGNGRTCGTCHRAEDNFGLTPAFIARLPQGDPLFVAETSPNLSENFENPVLMRELALILENQDGFGDLENNFNMRGIPHVLALRTSVESAEGPRTGWSGDGSPDDGSLRSFATGAVIQHFPLTTNRMLGVDFRLPTDRELDALEAFMLSLGRQEDLQLPLPLKGLASSRGQEIFLDNDLGKCNICHFNAGANGNPNIFGEDVGNMNFDTGVENLPDQLADLTGELVPPDDGFDTPGDGTFNTPPLVEAADTGPFFHNNSVETIEGSVAFYNGQSFNQSPAGQILIGATGSGIDLDGTQVVAVAAFLRVINTLENIRESKALSEASIPSKRSKARDQLHLVVEEIQDGIQVLSGGGLHPQAVIHLEEAERLVTKAADSLFSRRNLTKQAILELQRARDELVEMN